MPEGGDDDPSAVSNPYIASIKDFFAANKITSILLLVGITFFAVGSYLVYTNQVKTKSDNSAVQILSDESVNSTNKLIVEVSGAVVKPGVYELESGQRIEDALLMAGGFSEDASSDWVEKMLNRAAILTDGQKIYIPSTDEQSESATANNLAPYQNDTSTVLSDSVQLVNINSASQSELEALWGIGPVTAKNIIDQRPYSTVKELLDRGILKSNVYKRNESLLSVY